MELREPSEEESEVLYVHLEQGHNIDRRAADILQAHELPYVPHLCPHGFFMTICLLCNNIIFMFKPLHKLGETCPCYASVPEDVSEITDAD